MPAFKNRTIIEIVRSTKAFLYLDAGLTRSEILHPEQKVAQLQQKLEQTQEQLAEKSRQLREARESLSVKNERATASSLADTLGPGNVGRSEDRLRFDVATVLDPIQVDFGGGCSLNKAYMFASLIRQYDLKKTVDIGVYRGRSLFPQALAHRQFTGGTVYGVDPWSASEARESDNAELKEALDRWVNETEFQAIYEEVKSLKTLFGMDEHCQLLRQPSAEAAVYFADKGLFFDMVHVDGNHDTARVMEDIDLYLPRLNDGGYIVLDDISWESVKPAYAALAAKLPLVFERSRRTDDFAVFWNNDQPSGAESRRKFLKQLTSNWL